MGNVNLFLDHGNRETLRITRMKKESMRVEETQDHPHSPERKTKGIWNWLIIIALLLLVFHLLMLWYRWLRPDPEFLSFTSGIIEILAIASFLGLQTEIGRTFVVNIDDSAFIRYLLGSPQRMCMASWSAAITIMLVVYLGSPLAAEAYRSKGVSALEKGNYSLGIRDFRQAISLNPKNSQSHYDLATAYEALFKYDMAIEEYQTAIEYDASFWPAYNNLGRLLIGEGGDPEAGLSILLAGQGQSGDALGRAVISKNLALAYFSVNLPLTALEILDEAILAFQELKKTGENTEIYLSECFRIQAMVHVQSAETQLALRSWQDSLGYGLAVNESKACATTNTRLPQYCLDAQRWVVEAREQIDHLSGVN
jgi:tetratricopeptide (TPR) repeat protein